jgi:hypothetical protein
MKEYKNYMVQEIFEDEDQEWTVAVFTDYKKAVDFTEAYAPKEGKRIEIWGTDEDTDTFLTAETLYVRNLENGTSVNLDGLNPKVKELADRIYDEEGDPYNVILTDLLSLEGCYQTIEYLLDTIDSILE